MSARYGEIIRRNSRPLDPIPAGVQAELRKLGGIRAVLFDIYGTLLISGSGDVGTASARTPPEAFRDACAAVGIACSCDGRTAVSLLAETVARHHERSRRLGVAYPEVEIVAVWHETFSEMARRGWLDRSDPATIDFRRLAVEYEVRANPVWPMPGLERCLDRLIERGFRLGIISNAQFFTLELFPALLEKSLPQLGFAVDLQFYSFEHGQAKPGTYLYGLARQSLESQQIKADEVLYVGNDMLNDVAPSQAVGFKSALFAGDARSLRLGTGDDPAASVAPDLVVTGLGQLADCVIANP